MTRDQIIARLVDTFGGPATSYDPTDPADKSTNIVFTASDGFPSLRALTYGEIADALAEDD